MASGELVSREQPPPRALQTVLLVVPFEALRTTRLFNSPDWCGSAKPNTSHFVCSVYL